MTCYSRGYNNTSKFIHFDIWDLQQSLTFCRPSRTVCRFLLRISSLDSYFILRSGTTAIRLKRMSWYGSLRKSRAAAWEWSPGGVCRRWIITARLTALDSPGSGQSNPLHDDPPSFIGPFLLLSPGPYNREKYYTNFRKQNPKH